MLVDDDRLRALLGVDGDKEGLCMKTKDYEVSSVCMNAAAILAEINKWNGDRNIFDTGYTHEKAGKLFKEIHSVRPWANSYLKEMMKK